MALFGRNNKSQPNRTQPESPPSLSETDLADATRLMDQWDASAGQSDAMYDCAALIARRGGFKGSHATLMEVMDGKDSADVTQRPWRWWNEASRLAQETGNDVLAGRIFLFTHLFVTQIVSNLGAGDMDLGLVRPADNTYKSIAAIAVGSLARLAPDFLIHNTATGRVDVASALSMAEEVSGVTAPRANLHTAQDWTQPPQADSGPFNRW